MTLTFSFSFQSLDLYRYGAIKGNTTLLHGKGGQLTQQYTIHNKQTVPLEASHHHCRFRRLQSRNPRTPSLPIIAVSVKSMPNYIMLPSTFACAVQSLTAPLSSHGSSA